MKIYIASSNPLAASHVAHVLTAHGFTITSTWHEKPFLKTSQIPTDERVEIASEDRGQILESDGLVLIADSHKVPGGKFVEVGIAIGLRLPVVILGPEPRENVMLYLPGIFRVDRIEDIVPLFKPADNTITLNSSDLPGAELPLVRSDEPPAEPGEGFRYLRRTESIEVSDEIWSYVEDDWVLAGELFKGDQVNNYKVRRKVVEPNPNWANSDAKMVGWSIERGWEEFDCHPHSTGKVYLEDGVAYRFLTEGETIQAGDQYLGHVGLWNNTGDVGRKYRGEGSDFKYRRPIKDVAVGAGPKVNHQWPLL